MSEPRSVTRWINALKEGDEQAAQDLWQRYFDKLVALARRRLASTPRRVADEEDIALSAIHRLCEGAAQGRFESLTGRDELWRLLVTITVQKVIDQQRRLAAGRRGGGEVRGESVFNKPNGEDSAPGFDCIAADEPTPELLALMMEQHGQLLQSLPDDTLRRTALLRMEGHTNEAIAQQLGITPRSVERKLQRIRSCWSHKLRL